MYVYLKSDPSLYTVGFYDPSGLWIPESDWPSAEEAAGRVHFLNGGSTPILFPNPPFWDENLDHPSP